MNTKKVIVILLVIAILFSVGTIYLSFNADTDNLVAAGTNTITTIQSDSGNIGIEILEPPTGGTT